MTLSVSRRLYAEARETARTLPPPPWLVDGCIDPPARLPLSRRQRWAYNARLLMRMAVSFLDAHRGGIVGCTRYRTRVRICKACPHLERAKGRLYCNARKACHCPRSRLWPFSGIKWMARLRRVECPVERWS